MKSDIYTHEHGIEHILAQIDKLGVFCDLHPEDMGKLRLLAEEMLGLTVRMFENLRYEFFIEKTDWRRFTLNLSAATFVKSSQRDKLVSLSSKGENKAEKGFFGKISGIFESLIMDEHEYDRVYVPHYDSMGLVSYFALSDFHEEHPKKPDDEQWDGLEKSIIATLAKDMVIGVKSGKVLMIAVIEF
ncbi:MAG: hypothetical protein LBC96_02290 [Lachnospiraceae bacterium]|jgi:hypothetical protein|nr:hypothetical protein [Lachnospiraceae bacterium]